jgi:anaerobic selenocysteine-containing dehydrogenase
MFPTPLPTVLSLLSSTRDSGPPQFGRWKSHARGVPEVLDQIPIGLLHEEITTPGDGQLRGLIVLAGNPVVSAPESDRLDAAMAELECVISLDNYLNETSRHAQVILPGPSALEQPHFDQLYQAYSVRIVSRWSDPVFERPGGMPADWQTVLTLQGLLLGIPLADLDIGMLDDAYFGALAQLMGADPATAMSTTPERGPERLVDLALRTGPFGDRYGEVPDGWNLNRMKAHPHGVDLGPMVPQAANVVATPNGRIDLAPDHIVADLPRLAAKLGVPVPPLVLVSRRHLRSNNSWLHNVRVLVKGKDRCTLLVHPTDAAQLDLVEGGTARVSSRAGSIEVPVELSDEMMPGVVCLPHGWGHDRPGTRLAVAREHAGVNNNVLLPADFLDVPSNNVAANGIPVEVIPVR